MNINFSFIIPHKNNPVLLKRCINSIPKRKDLEIIVVDDNSEVTCKELLKELDVIVIYLDNDSSKGAGRARNIGLNNSKGKWLFFIDADDTLNNCISDFLDDILKLKTNVIYFNYSIVRNNEIGSYYCKYINEEDVDGIKYKITAPWNKIVRRQFLIDNSILFEECPVGNDIMFSFQVAFHSKDQYKIINKSIYNYQINQESIVHKRNNNSIYYLTICKHVYQMNAFFDSIQLYSYKRSILIQLGAILYKKGFIQFLIALKAFIINYPSIKRQKNYYVDSIIKR